MAKNVIKNKPVSLGCKTTSLNVLRSNNKYLSMVYSIKSIYMIKLMQFGWCSISFVIATRVAIKPVGNLKHLRWLLYYNNRCILTIGYTTTSRVSSK